MDKSSVHRTNMIGGGEVGAISVDMDKRSIHETNSLFWDTKGSDVLGATALPFYGAFVSEEKRQLFGDVSGKKMLEIGCGSGQSLQYLGERKASELWGMDLSENQIEKTKQHLTECGLSATLDGVFIFSWSHPIHKCVAVENDRLVFNKCYFDESWYSATLGESTLTLSDRKLSTYVNALAKEGFVIEQMIEESDDEIMQSSNGDFAKKAKMLPVTFVIKARKL